MENNIEKRVTEIGKSYWNNNGAYQTELDELYKKLVPDMGEANTVHGEMIRAISRLFYEFGNNGNCNIIDIQKTTETDSYTCNECNGDGEIQSNDKDDESETCDNCSGSGQIEEDYEVDGDIEISEYYQKMIDVLLDNLKNKKVISDLLEFLMDKSRGYSNYKFDNYEMTVYNNLCDEVMYQVLTTENSEREVTDK